MLPAIPLQPILLRSALGLQLNARPGQIVGAPILHATTYRHPRACSAVIASRNSVDLTWERNKPRHSTAFSQEH